MLTAVATVVTCRVAPHGSREVGRFSSFTAAPEVTVLLNRYRGRSELEFECADEVDIRFGASPPRRSERLGPVAVIGGPGGLRFGERTTILERVSLRAARPDRAIKIEGRPYRGWLHVRANTDGTLRVVNQLDIETYLEGVVASEMPANWPIEALRAQAIAARTYALHRIETGPEPPNVFALDDSIYTMAYRGDEWVRPAVSDAVRSTRGQVRTWRGNLFRTYFHSTCGGRTAAASEVFGDDSIAPLAGGVEDPFCLGAKYARWSGTLEGATFDEAADRLGFPERPDGIEVARSIEGRAVTVTLVGPTSRRSVSAVDFRLATGPALLRSTWWDSIDARPDGLHFDGRGFGHGVGLCQTGARGRAEAGRSAFEILEAYYPGSRSRRAWQEDGALAGRARESRPEILR